MKGIFKVLLSLSFSLVFVMTFAISAHASPAPPLTNLQFEYVSTDTLVSQGWLQFYDISTGQNYTSSTYPLSGSTLKLAIFRYGYGDNPFLSVNGSNVSYKYDPNETSHYWVDSLNEVVAFRDFIIIPLSDLSSGYNTLNIKSTSLNSPWNTLTDTITIYKGDNTATVYKSKNNLQSNFTKVLPNLPSYKLKLHK